ncbi:hypothetical protein OPV22_024392 [Ensete ventricosum]|uniref:Uncharacterized protein n=1 Tax=Ensete ventricosum TaxID=4639 RepID=A0AAV8Q9W6_ENSVE|nr:hypothetical protein OPV22_024392 [Ensete ventricosum]
MFREVVDASETVASKPIRSSTTRRLLPPLVFILSTSALSSLYCRLRYIITGSGFNCSAFACDLRESRIPVRCCKI